MQFAVWLHKNAPYVERLPSPNRENVRTALYNRFQRYRAENTPVTSLVGYAKRLLQQEVIVLDTQPIQDLAKLDRPTLKGIVLELKQMGFDHLVVYKQDTPETLKAKIEECLQELQKKDGVRQISTVPVDDCLGVYLDLTSAACMACPSKTECTEQFMLFLDGRVDLARKAQTAAEQEAPIEQTVGTKRKAKKGGFDGPAVPVLPLPEPDPDDPPSEIEDFYAGVLEYTGMENAEDPASDAYAFFEAICTEPLGTVSDLYTLIVSLYGEPESDEHAQSMTQQFLEIILEQGYYTLA